MDAGVPQGVTGGGDPGRDPGGGDSLVHEIALTPATIHIRDSKHPAADVLHLTPATWSAFLKSL
ncbi:MULTISPECIES: DUF397 domain-containing protein [unclassified Streptomyces]|uniref:DUF397 domain-containing protein n=1 Tax=unclassified Streptomyces TaxID=2593676 RepID=UPI002B1E5C4E|nr:MULTISPECIES: DUF397 domain-containing protein [unclassified Streptomyces]